MSTLYRKRLIPMECVWLKDDTILKQNEHLIITTWQTLHPRPDFANGISYYVLDKGWKISKFFTADGELRYIYCDIIDTSYNPDTDEYIFTDLLADVIIENDGRIRVLDLDELADALKTGILSNDLLVCTLKRLDELLKAISNGEFKKYVDILTDLTGGK